MLQKVQAGECPQWKDIADQSHEQELLGSADQLGVDRRCSEVPLEVSQQKIQNSLDSSTLEQGEALRNFHG
jgi:hypothetical protein